jgi:hypothetical protein
MDEKFFKNPINKATNGILATDTPGLRVIDLNDPDGAIYEYDNDGLPVKDDNVGLGSSARFIGLDGGLNQVATYINGAVLSELQTPYFPAGWTKYLDKTIIWGDRIVVTLNNGAGLGAVIVIFPDGTTSMVADIAEVTNSMTVDSRNNLWLGTATAGIKRLRYDEPDSYDLFNVAGGYVPSNVISGVVACGIYVWIITCAGTALHITKFNGYTFTNMSAQFTTDTGVASGASALTAGAFYSAVCDAGNPYFSMLDATFGAGENLFYYNESTGLFYIKTLPGTLATNTMLKFTKVGDYVYCLDGSTNFATIWQYSTATILSTGAVVLSDVRNDDQYVYFIAGADVWSVSIATSPVVVTQETTKINEMTAYVGTLGASLALVDVAVASPYLIFLNYDAGAGPPPINTILQYKLMMKWTIV